MDTTTSGYAGQVFRNARIETATENELNWNPFQFQKANFNDILPRRAWLYREGDKEYTEMYSTAIKR